MGIWTLEDNGIGLFELATAVEKGKMLV